MLGLHHPDEAAASGRNMVLDRSWAWNPCAEEVWDHVSVDSSDMAPASIMSTFTQNPSAVCVTQDDLDALNVLYPTCENTVHTPQCYKAPHYLGWLRLTIFVAVRPRDALKPCAMHSSLGCSRVPLGCSARSAPCTLCPR